MSVIELVREDYETKARRIARQRKWQRAEKARRHMTPDELAGEEARLIEEAAIMAKAMGLEDSCIGDRWSRPDPLDLAADGIFSEYAAGVRKEATE